MNIHRKSPIVAPDIRDYLIDGVLTLPEWLRRYPRNLHVSDVSDLKSLGNLKSIAGGLYIRDCSSLESFGELEQIDGPLDCTNCPMLDDLGQLSAASGYVNLSATNISSLPNEFNVTALLPSVAPVTRVVGGALKHHL